MSHSPEPCESSVSSVSSRSTPPRAATPAASDKDRRPVSLFGKRPRRPVLECPRRADPGVRGLEIWRRAVAAGWTVLALALLLLPPPLPAQATGPEEAEPGCDVGLLFRAQDGSRLPAPVLETDVQLQVTGLIVRARVVQRFANPHDRWLEGVYAFPLPETAAVDGLRMVIGERVIEGQIHEKEQARQVYEQAKRQGAKASLVEQQRPNLFTTRVANVGPGEEVEVELSYQQTLDWDAGTFRLRFPMTITPRFHPEPDAPLLPPTVEMTSLAEPTPRSVQPPPELPGLTRRQDPRSSVRDPWPPGFRRAVMETGQAMATVVDLVDPSSPPVNPLRLTVELEAGVPLAAVDSAHHRVEIDELDGRRGHYRVALQRGEVSADRDFELSWRPVRGAEPRTALFTETLGLDTYALLLMLPPDPELSGFRRLPRETIFVLDVSGSMQGASIRQAKKALQLALEGLEPEDSFNVLTFSDTTRALFPGSWPADPEVIERARNWVGWLQAGGGTRMLPALLAALDNRPDGYGRSGARALKQVVFITDGAVGNEAELFSAIERHLGDARLFTIGIGSAPNSHFMRRAAELGRGTYTFIGRPEQVQERMAELFAKVETPALTDVEVMWDDPGAEMYPPRVPDLYAGEPVVVAAKLIELGDEVRLSGQRDGSWWDETVALHRVDLASVGMASVGMASVETGTVGPGSVETGSVETGIAKLWARRKITALLDEWRRAPATAPDGLPSAERADLRRQVVELALEHHLVSRFTSLVAVDVTPSRPDGTPLASRRLPNVRPAGSQMAMPGYLPSGGTSSRLSLLLGLGLLGLALGLRRLLLAASQPRGHAPGFQSSKGRT